MFWRSFHYVVEWSGDVHSHQVFPFAYRCVGFSGTSLVLYVLYTLLHFAVFLESYARLCIVSNIY